MSFSGVGRIYLKAQADIWVFYDVDDFWRDRGAQWIMAHPEIDTGYYPQYGTAEFEVDHHRKQIYFDSGMGQQYVTYVVHVTNVGQMDTYFRILTLACKAAATSSLGIEEQADVTRAIYYY